MKRRTAATVALAALAAGNAAAAELGYYSHPALCGDRLVFMSEGDLWTATIPQDEQATIIAHRLTSSDGVEAWPHISPNGKWIAFAGEYDGNTDVYLMPIDGGPPRRLTFHPAEDVPLDWTPDGSTILFRSTRDQPTHRKELWRISIAGGMPRRYGFGECSLISVSAVGRQFAFTRWSNEHWTWKRYRGGMAPEIWIGDFPTETFRQLTSDRASDLFPMWLRGRVYFLSDRTNTFNIFSNAPQGGDLKQHTHFAPVPDNPAAIEGYDLRRPAADARRRGTRIVFAQAGGLALFDVATERLRRLDLRIASDRVTARRRFADATETACEMALSPDGKSLLLGTRGEILAFDVASGQWRQLTRTSHAREWAAAYLGQDRIALISDAAGEQQIAVVPADGSELPGLMTEDREAWLFPPATSADGNWIAFADKTMRLHALHVPTYERRQVDQAEAGEITEYRFSPDGRWLAYTKPTANGLSEILLYSLSTQRTFAVTDGTARDRSPCFDPAGKYLYFLSDRHLDPLLGRFDLEHVYVNATQIYAVPLAAATPPPRTEIARAADFDLAQWAKPPGAEEGKRDAPNAAEQAPGEAAAASMEPMHVDTDRLPQRHCLLPVSPGNYAALEASWGSICYLSRAPTGLLDEDWPGGALGPGKGTLHRFDLVAEEDQVLAEKVDSYVISHDRTTIAYPGKQVIHVKPILPPGDAEEVNLSSARLRVDIRAEWKQMFEEAWRLQRDFYWAPNMVGVDWPAMREKYAALLPRIGSRAELNDLIGQMIAELGTSHTYVWGGRLHEREQAQPVSVGMLGADIRFDGRVFRITRILPGRPWDDALRGPLAAPHLEISEGAVLEAINDRELSPGMNVYELLQDEAGKTVSLRIADDEQGTNRRTVKVKTSTGEQRLRYLAWVEENRRYVEQVSGGEIGYLHIPDMGGGGLSMFSRQFYPQYRKRALIIDVRDNGGGFVSQMILERLARKVLAFGEPRHGVTQRYPHRAPHAHMAALIDEHAGSDGDILPAAFREAGLGPLIGTRTWGGVVGIRADKPSVDFGLTTQPEQAWWSRHGWDIENEGVWPDIQVDITPADRLAGRDPQLERAIEYLMQKLEEDPKALPTPPPYPVRAPGAGP